MGIENPVHLLFLAVIALVVLGPKRLPELAKALGKGVREFREAINVQGAPAGEEHPAGVAESHVPESQPVPERQPVAEPQTPLPATAPPAVTLPGSSGEAHPAAAGAERDVQRG